MLIILTVEEQSFLCDKSGTYLNNIVMKIGSVTSLKRKYHNNPNV